jgi:outer membrane immunogenic protein
MIKPVPYKPLICPTAQVKFRIYGTSPRPTPRMHAPLTMLEWQALFTNKTPSRVAYAIGDGLEYGPPGRGCSVQGLYLHMGFGTNTYDLPDRLGCRLGRPVIETHADINPSFHIAHYGLNYRF